MESRSTINQELLFETIYKVAETIENELSADYGKGIFFVPELHFAFEVGKAIFKSRQEIFGVDKIEWLRETNLKNGGPSDLVFKTDAEWIVFEFKIADTWNSYEKDIKKLQRLSEFIDFQGEMYFVALVDTFPEKVDGRMEYLKNSGLEMIGQKSLDTNYKRYVQTIRAELVCVKVQ
jgi:hypothetical protein